MQDYNIIPVLDETDFKTKKLLQLPVIEKYFPLIVKANENGDLEKQHVAMMEDRMLMYQGKEQMYGTQGAGRLFVNPETKKEEWTNFI